VKFDWAEGTADCESSDDEDGDVDAGDADRGDENNNDGVHNNHVDGSRTKQVSKEINARNCDFLVTLDDAANLEDVLNVSVEAQPCASNQYKIVGDNIDRPTFQ